MPRSVTIALIQARAVRDKAKNLETYARMARHAVRRGARVVCFPELFATWYVGALEDKRWLAEAEAPDGPTVSRFRRIAQESKAVFVVPFLERARRAFYNSAAVVDADGSLLGVYRKVHLPHLPTARDTFYFKPGDRGFPVFETAYLKAGVLICHDRHFPESFRLSALAGAELILVPTASGRGVSDAFWEAEGQAAALANGVFVAALNKVGREPIAPTPYYGRAYVADPFGRILFQGGDRDEIVMGPIDLRRIEESRAMWSLLEDRRLDVYRPILAPWPKPRRARRPT